MGKSALVQKTASYQIGDKPLSELMSISFLNIYTYVPLNQEETYLNILKARKPQNCLALTSHDRQFKGMNYINIFNKNICW